MDRALLLALALLAGCGSSAAAPPPAAPAPAAPAPAPAAAPDPAVLAPPFSAADLRAGLPAGTEIKLRVTAAGKAPVIQHWIFTAADERGCTIQASTLATDGTLIKDEGAGTSTWEELSTHGQFPAALTTRTESSVEVTAGRFETWLFEVRSASPGAPTRRVHFARTLPGPPVHMEVVQDGKVVLELELLSRTQP